MSTKPDSVKLYKVRKLITELASKEGRGTELVSLYIPPKKPIHEVIANLREEWGTAGNIKSDTTRNHVQDALTRAMQRLKLYRTAPDTGLVIFCGALPTNGLGSEVINLYEIAPPKPVTAYLYQCLAPDTRILTESGEQRTMEELKSDWSRQKVMSVDFSRKEVVPSKIGRYLEIPAGDRRSFRLTSDSGREILATEDHPFYTPTGWKRLDQLREGDLVCVLPLPDLGVPHESVQEPGLILEERRLYQVTAPPKNMKLVVKRLNEQGLLPLRYDNPKLPAIARLLGHLFSDGSLTKTTEQRKNGSYNYFTIDCSVGRKADESEVLTDVRGLGYEAPKGREVVYTMNVEGRKYTARTRHLKLRQTALVTLLRALGAPVGKKVVNAPLVPEWLLAATPRIKKEFLSTYLGGDGEAPRLSGRNVRTSLRISFHRVEQKRDSGLKLAKQLCKMFEDLGVAVRDVDLVSGYVRKDGLRTIEIRLRLDLSETNVLAVCHRIGFRYSSKKSLSSNLVGEYLRIKSQLRRDAVEKVTKAKAFRSTGMQIAQIGELLSVPSRTVSQWSRGLVGVPLVTAEMIPTFAEWSRTATNNLAEPLLWEGISKIEPVYLSDVRDLTVGQESHGFFANGFMVHNCDDHFHLEWLKDMLREEKVFGMLVIDASEAGLGILSGDSLEIPDLITSGISGKTRKGGQSARRYERGREMELTYYYHRVAEHATRVFIDGAKVTGMIVGGPGPTKEEFLKGGYLHYELQKKVLAVIDLGYSGREGVRELVEKASDTLQDVRLVEEKKLVQKFLSEVNRPGGLAVYGLPRVLEALRKANAEVVLVSEDLGTVKLEAKCRKCRTVKEDVVLASSKVQKKQEMISEACKSCGSMEYDIIERDIVDILEESALQVGSKVEVISSGTEEGKMFRSFGGIAVILRYRPG